MFIIFSSTERETRLETFYAVLKGMILYLQKVCLFALSFPPHTAGHFPQTSMIIWFILQEILMWEIYYLLLACMCRSFISLKLLTYNCLIIIFFFYNLKKYLITYVKICKFKDFKILKSVN